jgi:type I restriction enzyme M protein
LKEGEHMSLSATIKNIQDIMRKDVGVDGDAQRISQLGWMLFLKIWDDREKELEITEEDYRSPLVGVKWNDSGQIRKCNDLRWSAWASDDEGLTGEGLLSFVNDELFPALREMVVSPANAGNESLRKRQLLIQGVFSDSFQYMKSGTLLRQIVNVIEKDINFNDSKKRHLFGDIYEKILKDLQSAGNAGEYYTPRAATQFAVEMTNPKLGDVILDPACGTGGFLTGAIEHIRKNGVTTPEQESILQDSIRGVEKKPLPHLLCTTNMIVHGLDTPSGIVRDNTLARPLRNYSAKDRVDVVLTNPPFGGVEEDGIEANFPADFRTRETADLFLVLIMALLNDGGKAAVVLPDGTLFGEGVKTRIKEKLLDDCNLHTVFRFPKSVFAPYTSIATNILFFTKGQPTREVWYYEHSLPEGYKAYSKTKPMKIEEFATAKQWWENRVENENAWRVNVDDIRNNGYNLDIKNPNKPEHSFGDPVEILSLFNEEKVRGQKILEKLRDALSEALLR